MRVGINPVIIAGGGIGGLATALTLHQIGVPCVVYRSGPRDAPARRRHQHAAQRGARALRSRLHARPISTASACPRRNGRWSGSTATTSIPSRAACSPATLAAIRGASRPASTCCCTSKVVERIGPRRGAARQPRHRLSQECRWRRHRADRTCRRLDIGEHGRAADRRRRHPLGDPRADASRRSRRSIGAAR